MVSTTSNTTTIGASCAPVIHKKYSCGIQDFLITDIQLDHETGNLYIYQNPDNCKSIQLSELLQIDTLVKKVSSLINDKVDKIYNLNTENGIQGGGTFESTLTLSINPNDEHIELSEEGIKIKLFTEVLTSGTVPSPTEDQKSGSHFLNALGEWTKVDAMRLKGIIDRDITIDRADIGDIYIIKELEDPDTIVNVNEQEFKSTDVIMWDGSKFVDIGNVQVQVNLKGTAGTTSFIVENTAGNGFTIPAVTGSKAGLITPTLYNRLNSLYDREFVISVSEITQDGDTAKFTVTSQSGGNSSTTKDLIIISATQSQAGLMSKDDKKKLDSLNDKALQSNWSIEDSNDRSYIKNKPTVLANNISDGKLVPTPAAGIEGERYLKWDGTWSEVKSSPPISVQTSEPTGDYAVEGAIWIVP